MTFREKIQKFQPLHPMPIYHESLITLISAIALELANQVAVALGWILE